ncbi:Uncharacterised protein [Mycobacterium tuberculosis]|nr:Uncharacterised protein [Mycobacterium tuberculosis]CNN34660.1 Uncharacterised protein [Mycobacterium tuberculosis]COV80615.1 Uncharacterised protein [Mycobacterium tuberculosis]
MVCPPMASRLHTPYTGMPSACPYAAAEAMPARSPVNGPGPQPTTTASRSAIVSAASASAASTLGVSRSACARASTVTLSPSTTRS